MTSLLSHYEQQAKQVKLIALRVPLHLMVSELIQPGAGQLHGHTFVRFYRSRVTGPSVARSVLSAGVLVVLSLFYVLSLMFTTYTVT